LLPEDGIVLPKHVGAIVKGKIKSIEFRAFCWLFSAYSAFYLRNVRPSVCIIVAPTEGISVKSDVGNCNGNLSAKSKFG
jgi:hypothetical protein